MLSSNMPVHAYAKKKQNKKKNGQTPVKAEHFFFLKPSVHEALIVHLDQVGPYKLFAWPTDAPTVSAVYTGCSISYAEETVCGPAPAG